MQTRAARASPTALGAMVLGLMTSQVGAQPSQGTQVSNQASADLQETLVSATRRLEDIQEIPLSVTAFSAAQLEAKGVENFFDYGTAVPNLPFGLGASDGSLAARGIALRGVQGPNTTGLYIRASCTSGPIRTEPLRSRLSEQSPAKGNVRHPRGRHGQLVVG